MQILKSKDTKLVDTKLVSCRAGLYPGSPSTWYCVNFVLPPSFLGWTKAENLGCVIIDHIVV